MDFFLHNHQQELAEQYQIIDFHIIKASKLANMRVKSWKMANEIQGLDRGYLKEIEEYIQKTLFSTITNTYILKEEGFYFSNVEN